jgi:hypothetical protein
MLQTNFLQRACLSDADHVSHARSALQAWHRPAAFCERCHLAISCARMSIICLRGVTVDVGPGKPGDIGRVLQLS